MAEPCFVCGKTIAGNARVVLARGKRRQAHCSEACLRENVRGRRIKRARTRRRWFLRLLVVALLPVGAKAVWRRYHAPPAEAIVSGLPEPIAEPAPSGPIPFGPAWPPTDADWTFAFNASFWTYPLPGPVRRHPTIDGRIFGPEPPPNHPATCRQKGHCGVELGGELWGEHVYAVHDGVVERVQSTGVEERGGVYVRVSHFGGMVFTQYFHLAATPRGIVRGAHVRAGDLLGSLGDTGVSSGERRHLHFALSIRPSNAFSEVYWDPEPLMATWPLRLPVHGTVAGFTSAEKPGDTPRRRRSK